MTPQLIPLFMMLFDCHPRAAGAVAAAVVAIICAINRP